MGQEEYKSFKLSGVIKKVLYKNEETKYIIAVLENNQKMIKSFSLESTKSRKKE